MSRMPYHWATGPVPRTGIEPVISRLSAGRLSTRPTRHGTPGRTRTGDLSGRSRVHVLSCYGGRPYVCRDGVTDGTRTRYLRDHNPVPRPLRPRPQYQRWGSNPHPRGPQPRALPTELHWHGSQVSVRDFHPVAVLTRWPPRESNPSPSTPHIAATGLQPVVRKGSRIVVCWRFRRRGGRTEATSSDQRQPRPRRPSRWSPCRPAPSGSPWRSLSRARWPC